MLCNNHYFGDDFLIDNLVDCIKRQNVDEVKSIFLNLQRSKNKQNLTYLLQTDLTDQDFMKDLDIHILKLACDQSVKENFDQGVKILDLLFDQGLDINQKFVENGMHSE